MSIKSPTVSIIISAGENNIYLLESINSVRQQTFTNFELLICYQGNSHSLVDWFDRFSDSRLRLFMEENLDRVQMLNLAIKGARGKYIAFLEAGDLWHPNKLQKQVFYLDRYPAIGVVHSWVALIDEGGQSIGEIDKNKLSGWVQSKILLKNLIGYSSVMIRWDCFDKIGLFDPNLQTSFDWDLWIRLSHVYQFSAIAESLVYQRQDKDLIKESWLIREKDFQTVIEKAYQNTAPELLRQKNSSYGYASLSLARSVLDEPNPDVLIANHYCRQALEHCPRISFSLDFLRLSLAVLTLHCLKSDRYLRLLSLIKTIRNQIKTPIDKFKAFAHLVLNWMLEEKEIRRDERVRDEG